MHYKNGREVKIGDQVVGKDWQGNALAGIVVKTAPGAETCNIGVIPVPTNGGIPSYNAGEFLHIEDALMPRPQESA
jgi:hypothetical protein